MVALCFKEEYIFRLLVPTVKGELQDFGHPHLLLYGIYLQQSILREWYTLSSVVIITRFVILSYWGNYQNTFLFNEHNIAL